jgi:hypothetical protein
MIQGKETVFQKPMPAPRYIAYDIIDPIMSRLKKSPAVRLNCRKIGNPEKGKIDYIILAPQDKQSNGMNNPFARVALTECMRLRIEENGNLTLSQYITKRFGRHDPYGELKANPRSADPRAMRILLGTFVSEVDRYYAKPFTQTGTGEVRGTAFIRQAVFGDNPLQLKPKNHCPY